MKGIKSEILSRICYTELVYERINKKLNRKLSKPEIEQLIFDSISETNEAHFQKKGKNYYISNTENNIRITVNSFTYRVITIDLLNTTNHAM